MKSPDVSALFVWKDGIYPRLVADCWDEERDATRYIGPRPIVAHPPCKRWGRFWWRDGSDHPGEDGGLFNSALVSIRCFGGVIEHPAHSHAWARFDLPRPPRSGWAKDVMGGWSTEVSQRNYGHRARKLTWLYYVGKAPPPAMDWSEPAPPEAFLIQNKKGGTDPILSKRERSETPEAFARALIDMAAHS